MFTKLTKQPNKSNQNNNMKLHMNPSTLLAIFSAMTALVNPAIATTTQLGGQYGNCMPQFFEDLTAFGSEDLQEWKDGIFFVSAGLEGPFGFQQQRVAPISNGAIYALTFPEDGANPELTPLPISGLPAEINFRAHGIFIEGDELFVVSHNEPLVEENIVVFRINDDGVSGEEDLPTLEFKGAFTSPQWTPVGSNFENWHLNDLVVVDDGEILVTQLGPLNIAEGVFGQRALWSCKFDEDVFDDAGIKIPIDCEEVIVIPGNLGLNGITIDDDKEFIYVNNILNKQLVKIRRGKEGVYTLEGTVQLPSIVDNVQYVDGKIIGGSVNMEISDNPAEVIGGLVVADADLTTADLVFQLDPLFLQSLGATTEQIYGSPVPFLVSSVALHEEYLVLGSFTFAGVVICSLIP